MSSSQGPTPALDRYVVIHVATTCDEHGVYVTKDSAEVIEIGWIVLEAGTLDEKYRDSVLVKPVNTPITPLCTSLTTITIDTVLHSGTFRDAINRLDSFIQEKIIAENLEFSFVTLDSWELRVQLPREARDKAVVLPPYLQHSRTYDLRAEYQRWQAHHPESLPFSGSALTNICAALEVEPVQTSAPIKHNLPFHLQALAPASPRRAMEEAVTLARVLKGLIRKSQPPHEHQDVLTRPMDARADVRAFLSERSKVLHMSGLPHDTTQSELESWFTQFGGRPIAFWTLRTPDQHKPTGTGFAIFSSHEEAAESLCMNGRALNEKAIEVSPSSSRVLDRAADILQCFPPSKNRPRPGDWTCPSCGFSNFQRRTACFRCSFPAMASGPQGEPMGGYQYGYGHGPMMHNVGPAHHMHGGGGHHGHHGGHHGMHGHMGRGSGGGMVPFRAGDWKCGSDGCGYHNFAKNVSCLRCGASRAGAAVVADSAFPSGMETPGNFGHMGSGHQNMHGHHHHHGPPSIGSASSSSNSYGGGFPGPGGYGGPSHSGYGMPSGMAAPAGMGAPNPYGGAVGHNPYMPNGGAALGPGASNTTAGFDNGAAHAAFTGTGNQQAPQMGAGGFSNGTGGPTGAGAAAPNSAPGFDPSSESFSFLNAGFGNLNISDDARRSASGNKSKSPA